MINGSILKLSEVEAMGFQEFSFRAKLNIPLKLYHYYPNTIKTISGEEFNYSQIALKNNTVYMQSPIEFDDVYDSEISIDFSEYERYRLLEYCRRCNVEIKEDEKTQEIGDAIVKALWNYYLKNGSLDGVFVEPPTSMIQELANNEFCLQVLVEYNNTHDFGAAVTKTIQKEYNEYSKRLKNTFRAFCFATSPYSQLMWGGVYADNHRGFCVEYTVLPNDNKYKDIFYNLFPVIYCRSRPNITGRISASRDQMYDEEKLWDLFFHGALRKSIDWAFQNEWRLLLPFGIKDTDFNVKFFPITKVYLGNRMPKEKRKEIIAICKERGIPYIGVKRNPGRFEMQDCEILCEDCPYYR